MRLILPALRIAALLVIAMALSACGSAHRASQPNLPPALTHFAHKVGWNVRTPPLRLAAAVSKHRAEAIAFAAERLQVSPKGHVRATLAKVVGRDWCIHHQDGTCPPVRTYRLAWIVRFPHQHVWQGIPGETRPVKATVAVLVDAYSGKVIEGVAA